MFIEGILTV